MLLCPSCFWDSVLLSFCSVWPWTMIPPISSSWVDGITVVCQHACPLKFSQ
jgi:hypothetical protein